jgi:hypothetical protein
MAQPTFCFRVSKNVWRQSRTDGIINDERCGSDSRCAVEFEFEFDFDFEFDIDIDFGCPWKCLVDHFECLYRCLFLVRRRRLVVKNNKETMSDLFEFEFEFDSDTMEAIVDDILMNDDFVGMLNTRFDDDSRIGADFGFGDWG